MMKTLVAFSVLAWVFEHRQAGNPNQREPSCRTVPEEQR
jgi:hypothetical protein